MMADPLQISGKNKVFPDCSRDDVVLSCLRIVLGTMQSLLEDDRGLENDDTAEQPENVSEEPTHPQRGL